MNLSVKKLIDTGAIICGRIIKEDGIVKFERIESSQIESISKEERSFVTASMEEQFLQLMKMEKYTILKEWIHIFKYQR